MQALLLATCNVPLSAFGIDIGNMCTAVGTDVNIVSVIDSLAVSAQAAQSTALRDLSVLTNNLISKSEFVSSVVPYKGH